MHFWQTLQQRLLDAIWMECNNRWDNPMLFHYWPKYAVLESTNIVNSAYSYCTNVRWMHRAYFMQTINKTWEHFRLSHACAKDIRSAIENRFYWLSPVNTSCIMNCICSKQKGAFSCIKYWFILLDLLSVPTIPL